MRPDPDAAPPPEKNPAEPFDLWIEAGHAERHYWRDLWRYRELFIILAWRDIAVRYKQAVAGVAWALLQPLATMFVLLFIGWISGLSATEGAPYAIVVFSALLPWQFFANGLTTASQSIVGNANMISKVYFPRLIIPASSIAVALVDFAISVGILGGLMAWYQFWPGWRLLALPLLTLLAIVAALGGGLFITALTVRYRDFRFIIPFIIQFGMYLSPVLFTSAQVREKVGEAWFQLYCLNPMVCVIDGFRWAVLGGEATFLTPATFISLAVAVGLLFGGIAYFRKTERSFADII